MSNKNKVPDRWEKYTDMSRIIPGTRFIVFKVPLREEIMKKVKNAGWFCPRTLMDHCQHLGLVIDLTDTFRYYNPEVFQSRGITHIKIRVMGRKIPEEKAVNKFFQIVNKFMDKNKENEKIIGVHCTHGLNRTGYLVCRYMIQVLGIPPDQAIADFNSARGHEIERENYLQDLREAPWMFQPVTMYSSSPSPPRYRNGDNYATTSTSLDASTDNNTSALDTTTASEAESPESFSFRPGTNFNLPLLPFPGVEVDEGQSLGPVPYWTFSPQEEREGRRARRRSRRNYREGDYVANAPARHQERFSPQVARRYYDQTYQGRVAPQYDSQFYQQHGSGVGPHRPLPRYQRQQLQEGRKIAPRRYRGPRQYQSPAAETTTAIAGQEEPLDSFKSLDAFRSPDTFTAPDTLTTPDPFKAPDAFATPDPSRTPRLRPRGPMRNPLSPGARDDVFNTTPRRSARMTPY